jgi:hypothetical protein
MNQTIPPYTSELFVNRTAEIGLVEGYVQQMKGGEENLPRTIVFQGERGSGKTWLSLHLKRSILLNLPQVDVLLLGLSLPAEDLRAVQTSEEGEWNIAKLSNDIRNDPDKCCKEIFSWITEQMHFDFRLDSDVEQLGSFVVNNLADRLSHRYLVLILDSVFEAEWPFLEKFERYFLAPLAAQSHVLILMTGRGMLYPWISPYLRVRVIEERLEPFTTEDSLKQIQLQVPESKVSISRILEVGGGYPIANVYLAKRGDDPEALNEVIDLLLSVIPLHQRDNIRKYFEALCVLEGFRDDEIKEMLGVYLPQGAPKDTTQVRAIRDQLVSSHLVQWKDGRYVIDEIVRRVLENYLMQTSEQDKWAQLHDRANQLYKGWAQKYPRFKEYYDQRAQYHEEKLNSRKN